MRLFFTVVAFAIFYISNAQKQVEVKINLRDGNLISGTTNLSDIVLKTNYGQLTIPIQKVSVITFGVGKDKAVNDKASMYLKVLNSASSDENKKSAYQDLIKLGIKAISSIYEFQSDPKNLSESSINAEFNIDNALSELVSNYNVSDDYKIEDVILIENEYNIGGVYDLQKLDIKTEFGVLSIPKDKIKFAEITYIEPNSSNEFNFKLNANKHISGNQNGGWLKTGVMLKQGQRFSISASGEVTLASLSNQKYNPNGSYITSSSTNDVPSNSVSFDELGNEVSSTSYPSYGNVVYKIGDNSTEVLRAGAKFTGVAKKNGMLYISIYETVYNSANSGYYTVKVKLN
jgi:hypothetical protein